MLTMKDMIYYNPRSNPMPKSRRPSESGSEVKIKTEIKEERSKTPPPPPVELDPPKSQIPIVPQLKLGPNGEMILDEKSLVIESLAEKEAKKMRENSEVVFDDGNNGKYGYFKRQKRTRDWTPEETIRFYRCLHTVGTDFSLMIQLFPDRNRRDLKIKFKKEEKTNGHLIDKALLHPKEFDIEALKREFDQEDAEKAEQEASSIERADREKKLLRKRKNEELKEMRKSAPSKDLSKTQRNFCEVDSVYSMVEKAAAKKRKVSQVKNLEPVQQNTPFSIKNEAENIAFTITYVPEAQE